MLFSAFAKFEGLRLCLERRGVNGSPQIYWTFLNSADYFLIFAIYFDGSPPQSAACRMSL